jgi:hypothetical protein
MALWPSVPMQISPFIFLQFTRVEETEVCGLQGLLYRNAIYTFRAHLTRNYQRRLMNKAAQFETVHRSFIMRTDKPLEALIVAEAAMACMAD